MKKSRCPICGGPFLNDIEIPEDVQAICQSCFDAFQLYRQSIMAMFECVAKKWAGEALIDILEKYRQPTIIEGGK